MRDKNFKTGLRGVLFEAQHHARMGAAVWLYGWLVLRQTHQCGDVGYVLGGTAVAYREIEEETGFNRRTLEAWMRVLRREGYVETRAVPGGVAIRILRAKKHIQNPKAPAKESATARRVDPWASKPNAPGFPHRHRYTQAEVRGFAEGLRESAEPATRNCVAGWSEEQTNDELAGRNGSEFVVGVKEKGAQEIHTHVENCAAAERRTENRSTNPESSDENVNPSWLGQIKRQVRNQNQFPGTQTERLDLREQLRNACSEKPATHNSPADVQDETASRPQQKFSWEMREQFRLAREQREEEVRRELHVGTGPEVRRG